MKRIMLLSLGALLFSSSLFATELEDKVDALIEEIESLKISKTDSNLTSYTGLGQGLSKVYNSDNKLSIGGYGHTDYIDKRNSQGDTADNYRAILYLGYKFSDSIIFNSEIEFEHANEMAVEFAAIDFLDSDAVNWRVGNFIVPMGHINLQHEPTLFNTVTRPETERNIIPSTWHENGLMLYGKMGSLDYSLSLIAALDANKGETIRSMRSSASKSAIEDLATVVRVSYKPLHNFEFTLSGYYGEADQGNTALNGAANTIVEAHAVYTLGALKLTGFYAQTQTSHADKIALEHNTTAASSTNGYYINAAYNIDKWIPFIRFESYNTFQEGFDATSTSLGAEASVNITAIGVNYFPHSQVVIKADYLFYDNQGTVDDRLELGIGYLF